MNVLFLPFPVFLAFKNYVYPSILNSSRQYTQSYYVKGHSGWEERAINLCQGAKVTLIPDERPLPQGPKLLPWTNRPEQENVLALQFHSNKVGAGKNSDKSSQTQQILLLGNREGCYSKEQYVSAASSDSKFQLHVKASGPHPGTVVSSTLCQASAALWDDWLFLFSFPSQQIKLKRCMNYSGRGLRKGKNCCFERW